MNWLRRLFKGVLNIFKHNAHMKILSVIFAVILWNIVLSTTDPVRSKIITNIPIELYGEGNLASQSLMIEGNLSEIFHNVSVEVSVAISEFDKVSSDRIKVTANLSNIKSKGEYDIALSASSSIGTIENISPSVITVNVEEAASTAIPVVLEYTGKLRNDLFLPEGGLKTMQTAVEISGLRKYVETAANAVCTIDLSEIQGNEVKTFNLIIKDQQGADITEYVQGDRVLSTIVEINVLNKKSVPLVADMSSVKDSVAKGHTIAGLTINPGMIDIIGKKEDLERIDSLTIKPVSVKGLTETKEFPVELVLPNNVQTATETEIMLTVIVSTENQ